MKGLFRLAVILTLGALCTRGSLVAQEADLARTVLERAGISHGIAVIIEPQPPQFPLDLVQQSQLLVHTLSAAPEEAQAVREWGAEQGFGIDRLISEHWPHALLPHTANLVDLCVIPRASQAALERTSCAECLRILHPGGKLLALASPGERKALEQWAGSARAGIAEAGGILWLTLTKPQPPGADTWSHWEHGPDNNPVSTDATIAAPYMTQWLGLPYYIAMPAITTAAGGRTFTAMGHIAHHEREEYWLNTILARNGYNGCELWQFRLPNGYLVHRSAFIATPEAFYMIDTDGSGCRLLDPETGQEKGHIDVPSVPGEWKWIALQEGTLFLLAGEKKDPPETTIVRSEFPAWSWNELSKGYYERPRIPWGFGETLAAVDVPSGKVRWVHREPAPVDSRALVMGEGKLFFYAPDSHLGCLDARSGKVIWTNDAPETRQLIEQAGQGLSSTPGFRTTCYALYTPKGLIYAGQTRMNVVAVSKDDGSLMWRRTKTTSNPNAIYLDGKILIGIGEDGSTLVLDPGTGETIEDLGFKKRSCVRLTATPDSLFCRGWPEGLTRYDRASGQITFNGAMRPACNDGVIASDGLLYVGPWLCDCNLSLMGTVSLCSAGTPAPERLAQDALEPAPDVAEAVQTLAVEPGDWSAHRGGTHHTGSSPADLEPPLHPLWAWEPPRPCTSTAATAAGGLVFSAGDDGIVHALDATTGAHVWAYPTAGPILQPPALWNGRAYVGSGDGYVYALEAATGRLLWRFRAAPYERRTMVYGHLCSTWPVNSGIVIRDGIAYFAAGVIDYDGTCLYAIDAESGRLVWQNAGSGHLDPALRKGVSAQGNITLVGGKLYMAGGNVISPATYSAATGEYLGQSPGDGSPRNNRGEEIGVLGDDIIVHGGRLRYSAIDNVVSPGKFSMSKEGGPTRELAQGRIAPVWDDELMVMVPSLEEAPRAFSTEAMSEWLRGDTPGIRRPPQRWTSLMPAGSQTIALALARDAVAAACLAPKYRSLEPEWHLLLMDRADGASLSDIPLPGPVRCNGLSIDREGRVLVAFANGGLACFGGQRLFEQSLFALVESATEPATREAAIRRIHGHLANVHSHGQRLFLIQGLEKLGEDPFAAAKANGAITHWRLLGPVPWDDQHPLDKDLIREPRVKLGHQCKIDGEKYAWDEYITLHPQGMIDLAGKYGPHDSHAVYAYAEIELDADADLTLCLGTNDGFKCWFNEEEVGRFDGGRAYSPDQDDFEVHATKGKNRILLKVTQMGGAWAFGARLTQPDGAPCPFHSPTP